MWIKNLKLTNFRNYSNVEVDFEKGVNYIQGSNGAGKTSLVEAIGLLPLCKSVRSSDEKEVIKINEEFARVEAIIQKDNVEKMKMVISSNGKLIENNDVEIKKTSEIAGIVKVVTFLPKDVELFKEVPAKRRKFIDLNLSMMDKTYLSILSEYNKYLVEVRTLIKNENIDYTHLQILVEEMAKRGLNLQQKRSKFIESLNEEIKSMSNYLGEKELSIKVIYHPDVEMTNLKTYCKNVYEKLAKNIRLQRSSRITIPGIHLDDISVNYNNMDLATYGSQGQNRLSVIAIKLGIFKMIKDKYHEEPIVILDDVMSELDDVHQNRLVALLNKLEQVFITGTQVDLKEKYTLYNVIDNNVRRSY